MKVVKPIDIQSEMSKPNMKSQVKNMTHIRDLSFALSELRFKSVLEELDLAGSSSYPAFHK